jgi:hypothetical protein
MVERAKVLLLCAAEGNKPKANPRNPAPFLNLHFLFTEEEKHFSFQLSR